MGVRLLDTFYIRACEKAVNVVIDRGLGAMPNLKLSDIGWRRWYHQDANDDQIRQSTPSARQHLSQARLTLRLHLMPSSKASLIHQQSPTVNAAEKAKRRTLLPRLASSNSYSIRADATNMPEYLYCIPNC